MEDSKGVEWNGGFAELYWSEIGVVGLVAAISGLIILGVFFNLAFNASKLSKKTNYKGTKILSWSCWCLALMWAPMLAITYFFEDYEVFYVFVTALTTIFMVSAAYGFRKLTTELTSNTSKGNMIQ